MAEKTKFHLILAYVGTHYQGWQRQNSALAGESIQQTLETAIESVTQNKPQLMGSGRTDSGVHARRQHVHLLIDSQLNAETLLKALNAKLPHDIRVLSLTPATKDFHAQKSAKTKTYRYFILNNRKKGSHTNWPFLRAYNWFVAQPLDIEAIRTALQSLEGEHDFRSFQNRGTPVKSTVRTILVAELKEHIFPSPLDFPWEPPPELDLRLLEIRLTGTGFLKQMVRNIVGTLVEIGQNKMSQKEFLEILSKKDRQLAGVTAPARGLFLDQVFYE